MFRRAFFAALALGWLVAFGLVLLRGHRLIDALFVSAVTAGPAVAASAIVAGCYAVVGTRANPAWSPRGWLSRGAAVAALSGGVSWPLWLTIMMVPNLGLRSNRWASCWVSGPWQVVSSASWSRRTAQQRGVVPSLSNHRLQPTAPGRCGIMRAIGRRG